MERIEIKLNSVERIKKFSQIVCKYVQDVNLYKGHNVFDAKSIISLYTAILVDFSEPVYVELISSSKEEQETFDKTMKEFI